MEEGIKRAKEMGLDGICITDHDMFADKAQAALLSEKYGIVVIVGIEILTYEGDIICYGLRQVPKKKLHAQELIDLINKDDGVAIAAHPYRNNDRGMGDHIKGLKGLHGIETFNGNTDDQNNAKAKVLAESLKIPQTGGSDAHRISQIGCYSTEFINPIYNESNLIKEIKLGNVKPVTLG
jgi:hypothetical protein